ncbi:hypothetical protein A6M27_16715 [Acidithiobacillus thiooxidans]|uniref:Uncharacterized protein n=1 Tax=Acidithiobacillus thiooxidans TaxID=930 RepID=A0A1C2JFQ4_ACITH|nr:hypothetical protein A6O24_14640 [Acidithiobacillus thiooxidans]OCX72553.1 hypothetical protein A6P07_09590 [Acidithiobacillus thiooxidans]OCX75347.1 hypothetical protein A6M23_03015 [Acidithiobacillus thiooxidans]OCX79341.1 hypothetical protein A6O26_16830 [Acidithiobacillus thiooxidans]OCX84082.1 hypothetical protein A6M27_16715 [Acidithiobacillus thiooxidans]
MVQACHSGGKAVNTITLGLITADGWFVTAANALVAIQGIVQAIDMILIRIICLITLLLQV